MLLPSRFVRGLRQCSKVPSIGCPSVGPRQAVGISRPSIRSRWIIRTLFELHAGRRNHQLPSDLLIDEGKSVLSYKNELPRVTSQHLIEALGKIGEEYQKPKAYAGKNDLSYSDAATAVLDWREARRQAAANMVAGRDEKWGLHPKDVLVDYLRHLVPILQYQTRLEECGGSHQMDNALLEVFNRRNERYFQYKGWEVADLMDWTWILTADTAERAALRLAYIGKLGMRGVGQHKSVPQFVYIFMLRRKTLNAAALRTLLIYIWDYMEWLSQNKARAEEMKKSGDVMAGYRIELPTGMEEFKFMLIIIRLLRSARDVMPAACESIVALLCRYLDDSIQRPSKTDENTVENRTAALAFMYNSTLKLVAEPASLHPFRSATHQQRAQFMILRRMNQFEPPLVVDRRGYRAVTRMQLMNKKTSREREWALLKAQSWPPWKENRLGIDADIGPEYGISRAREVLNQAREAGYATDDWDDAASILSGWDTDDSPTIQSRAILKDTVKKADERAKSMVWAARIKATRTLDEAWAAFLSYEDSGIERFAVVYKAMFEKLFYDAKRKLTNSYGRTNMMRNSGDELPLPGDGLDVYPAPISPHDAIYVRTAPPKIDDFTQRMIDHGIRPRAQGDFLVMLLRNAPSLAIGLRFLKASNLSKERAAALLIRHSRTLKGPKTQKLLEEVPPKLFAAFIDLLTRFALEPSVLIKKGDFGTTIVSTNASIETEIDSQSLLDSWKPASQALWLVLGRQPRERRPWYSVLAALARSGVISPFVSYTEFQSWSAIANWKTSCWLLEFMEDLDIALDLAAIKILCTGLEKAIFEAERVVHQKMGIENVRHVPRADLDLVLDKGLPLVKRIFRDVVRSEQMQQEIPQSLLKSEDQTDPRLDLLLEHDEESLSNIDDSDGSEEGLEDGIVQPLPTPERYLPPACLMPKLLEVPDTAQLHSFIRILGLRRDYQGLLDLIEWMALYSDEIRAVTEEQQNGLTMMRRCLTATRVFLERSWLYYQEPESAQALLSAGVGELDAAPLEIWQIVHDTIIETQHWGGWPTDEEVERYCMRGLFV